MSPESGWALRSSLNIETSCQPHIYPEEHVEPLSLGVFMLALFVWNKLGMTFLGSSKWSQQEKHVCLQI